MRKFLARIEKRLSELLVSFLFSPIQSPVLNLHLSFTRNIAIHMYHIHVPHTLNKTESLYCYFYPTLIFWLCVLHVVRSTTLLFFWKYPGTSEKNRKQHLCLSIFFLFLMGPRHQCRFTSDSVLAFVFFVFFEMFSSKPKRIKYLSQKGTFVILAFARTPEFWSIIIKKHNLPIML